MKRKHLVTLMSMVLVAAVSMGATLAYLTDKDSNTNTFTVGDVDITLDETDVDDTKTDIEENVTEDGRDKANAYHLLPGQSYVKDPRVTVLANSEDSYIRMIVEVEGMNELKAAFPKEGDTAKYYANEVFLLQYLVDGWNETTWVFVDNYKENSDGTVGTYEFRYKEVVKKDEANQNLEPLFTHVVIPGEIDNDHLAHLANVKIVAKAHAIQATGFDNADAAWAVFTE